MKIRCKLTKRFLVDIDIESYLENLKNSPVLNAIKASAISARKLVPSMNDCGSKFKQNGPIMIPVTM